MATSSVHLLKFFRCYVVLLIASIRHARDFAGIRKIPRSSASRSAVLGMGAANTSQTSAAVEGTTATVGNSGDTNTMSASDAKAAAAAANTILPKPERVRIAAVKEVAENPPWTHWSKNNSVVSVAVTPVSGYRIARASQAVVANTHTTWSAATAAATTTTTGTTTAKDSKQPQALYYYYECLIHPPRRKLPAGLGRLVLMSQTSPPPLQPDDAVSAVQAATKLFRKPEQQHAFRQACRQEAVVLCQAYHVDMIRKERIERGLPVQDLPESPAVSSEHNTSENNESKTDDPMNVVDSSSAK
jgi:hypothetical protein